MVLLWRLRFQNMTKIDKIDQNWTKMGKKSKSQNCAKLNLMHKMYKNRQKNRQFSKKPTIMDRNRRKSKS